MFEWVEYRPLVKDILSPLLFQVFTLGRRNTQWEICATSLFKRRKFFGGAGNRMSVYAVGAVRRVL